MKPFIIARGIVLGALPVFACLACAGDGDSRDSADSNRVDEPPAGHVIAPERRLKDYTEHLKYPPFNRPADGDTPGLDNWPGYNGRRVDHATILKILGHEVRKGSLHIAFQVNVKDPGRYTFDTLLFDKAGTRIATSSITRDLKPGLQKLEFLFYGKIMRDAGIHGVFRLKGINGQRVLNDRELDLLGRAELGKSPEGILAPLRAEYSTPAIALRKFTSKDWQSASKTERLNRIKKEIENKNKRK